MASKTKIPYLLGIVGFASWLNTAISFLLDIFFKKHLFIVLYFFGCDIIFFIFLNFNDTLSLDLSLVLSGYLLDFSVKVTLKVFKSDHYNS